jgi:O-antigen/teichoic acid export membrane protein
MSDAISESYGRCQSAAHAEGLIVSEASDSKGRLSSGRWGLLFRRFVCSVHRNRIVRNVLLLVGGTLLGQLAVIAASPIVARLYTPSDFGVLGIYTSLLTLLSVIVSLRYELAIPLAEDDGDALSLALASLLLVPTVAFFAGIVVFQLRPMLIGWGSLGLIAPYLWLLPIGMGLVGIYQVFNYWSIRKGRYLTIARTKAAQSITGVLAQCALSSLGAIGLLIGHVVGSAAGTTALAVRAYREDRHLMSSIQPSKIRRMLFRYRRFPQVSALSSVINSAGLVVPLLLFAAFYDSVAAGQFALVQRVVTLPMLLLGTAVAQVYFGEGANAIRRSSADMRALYLRSSRWLAVAAICPAVVLLMTSSWTFPLAFGNQWRTAGVFAQLLSPVVFVQLVVAPLSQTLSVIECQAWQLVWDCFRLILVIAVMYVVWVFRGSEVAAVAAYSGAMVVSYVILWLLQLVGISTVSRRTRSHVFD